VRYVLFYESADDVLAKAPAHFPAGDPFVRNGVVRDWYVREWNEILAGP
jgi:uncharacterized protein YciI